MWKRSYDIESRKCSDKEKGRKKQGLNQKNERDEQYSILKKASDAYYFVFTNIIVPSKFSNFFKKKISFHKYIKQETFKYVFKNTSSHNTMWKKHCP